MSDERDSIAASIDGFRTNGIHDLAGGSRGLRSYEPKSHDLDIMPTSFSHRIMAAEAIFDHYMPDEVDPRKADEIRTEINAFLSYYTIESFRDGKETVDLGDEDSVQAVYKRMVEHTMVNLERLTSMVELSRQSYNKIRKAIKDEPTMTIMGLGQYSRKKRLNCFEHLHNFSVFCLKYGISSEEEFGLIMTAMQVQLYHHMANISYARTQLTYRFYDSFKPYYTLPDLPQD